MERRNTADLSDGSSKRNRINQNKLFKITFFSVFLMLITVYLILFYGMSYFLSSEATSWARALTVMIRLQAGR